MRAWCNSQEILSGLPLCLFYLWFPEIPWCFYGQKQRQIGFMCYSWGVVELSPCHNQTTCSKGCCPSGVLLFSFNLLLVLSHFVSVTSVAPARVCARMQGHITPLWQQDLHYRPSEAFCWHCIFAAAAFCFAPFLFRFYFFNVSLTGFSQCLLLCTSHNLCLIIVLLISQKYCSKVV